MLEILDRLAGWWIDLRMEQAVRSLPPEMQELKLHRVTVGTNGFEVVMIAPAVVLLADQAAELLNQQNAQNYVSFDLMPRLDRGKPPIRVTVQWAHGESPASKAARLEAELLALRRGDD